MFKTSIFNIKYIMDKYKKSLLPYIDTKYIKTIKENFHIYEEIQDSIGPINGCGSYLHGGWSKDYSREYYEKQESLFNLFNQYDENKCDVLEIGTFDGSSGLIILLAAENRDFNIFGIDICYDYYPEKSISILNKHFNNKYKLIKGTSNNMLNEFKIGTKFDFIHIDADHSFQAVSQDILNCIRLSHKDTIWIFDDMDNIGVSSALKFHQDKFELIKIAGTHGVFRLKSKYLININSNLPTIVTALYDIRSKEDNNSDNVRKLDHYLKLGSELLKLEIPIIIFTEANILDRIKELRPKEFDNITKIITVDLEDTLFYKDIHRLKNNLNKFKITNINTEKDTPLYFIVNNNKFYFISQSIEQNPFDSSHFLWMDFGICHNVKNINQIRRWIHSVPNKIRQMEINPYIENISYKEYFKTIYHNVAGSLFSGSIENLKQYCELFNHKWDQILNEEWCQLDEAIMTIVIKENSNMFEHYYGDYPNLISGYDNYFQLNNEVSIQVIFAAINKCLNLRSYNKCYYILNYIKSYYLYNPHRMYEYLNSYIICNYYISPNKMLDLDIVEAITTRPINLSFLQKIQSNLKFYSNYKIIIKE